MKTEKKSIVKFKVEKQMERQRYKRQTTNTPHTHSTEYTQRSTQLEINHEIKG